MFEQLQNVDTEAMKSQLEVRGCSDLRCTALQQNLGGKLPQMPGHGEQLAVAHTISRVLSGHTE